MFAQFKRGLNEKKEILLVADKNEIVVYQLEGGEFHIEVRVENEVVWLTPVGYRIKSIQGTCFRQWANNVLREYMLKGYVVNPRMLTLQSQQKLIENVDTRLTAVKQRVEFFGELYI